MDMNEVWILISGFRMKGGQPIGLLKMASEDENLKNAEQDTSDPQELIGDPRAKGPFNHSDPDRKAADPLYQMLKPLHQLPIGKNAWNPQFIRRWWFWPASAAVLVILSYLYPLIWDLFAQ